MKRAKASFSVKETKSVDIRRCNLGANVPVASLGSKDSSQVTGVPVCVQRILSFTGGHMSTFDRSFLTVHLMNGTVSIVRCTEDTKVQDVIDHVVEQLGNGQKSQRNLYGLVATCEATKDQQWLHKDMLFSECHKELHSYHSTTEDWRFYLKIRFFFKTCLDFLQNDLVAFNYLYEQVKSDLRECSQYESLERDTAIKLASIEIRLVLSDKFQKTPNKKVSNSVLEDIEWRKFLPQSLLQGSEAKLLYKLVQKTLKIYQTLTDEECILRYCNTVSGFWRYDEEIFECQIWHSAPAVTARIAIGPTICVSYETSMQPSLTTLANFKQIQSVTISSSEIEGSLGHIRVMLSNEQSPLIIQCSSAAQARQLASLIDGYCCLQTSRTQTIWNTPYNSKADGETHCSEHGNIHKKDDLPDYAILEDVLNEKKSSVIKGFQNCPPAYRCVKEVDQTSSSMSPFTSTPDLLSNAQSSKVRPVINAQDSSSMDDIAFCHSSISLSSVSVCSQSSNISKLTLEAIQEKLRLQKLQSDDDAEWLHREEAKLSLGENHMKYLKNAEQCDNISKISCDGNQKKTEPSSDIPVDLLQQLKLDRTNDPLYCATTMLVRSILDLNGSINQGETEIMVSYAKAVGVQLKTMLNIVHSNMSSLPAETQDEVQMAQKTVSSDLGHLIDAMKLVIRYDPTDLAQEYRRRMLKLGHDLATDAKMLLDTIDLARKKKMLTTSAAPSKILPLAVNQSSPISSQSDALS